MKLRTILTVTTLTAVCACASHHPAVNAVTDECRTDTLSVLIESASSATLHGVTVLPPDTTRSVVRIERVEIERQTRAETHAASAEKASEAIICSPEAPRPAPKRLLCILALVATVVILLRRK